jgi:hypothetical protein
MFLQRGNVNSTLQMGVHHQIHRVVSVNNEGVTVLRGRCGSTLAQPITQLQPCHLADIDPRIDTGLQSRGRWRQRVSGAVSRMNWR